ncbi:MAG: hypothetical protein O2904_02075 [bacterium]|nr:hypothetical protein [bacterium]
MPTLYLTTQELQSYEALGDDVKVECLIEEESCGTLETDEELVVRLRLVASDSHPEVREIIFVILEALQQGNELDPNLLDRIPHASLPVVFFGMGVRGMSAFVELILTDMQGAEDIESLAALTKVRHLLVSANASPLVA